MANTSRISRILPQANVDTVEASNRGGRYGEQYELPLYGSKHLLADEGSYFVATNTTPGTPIALITSITAYAASGAATAAVLVLTNTESRSATAPKRVYFDYIKLLCVDVPTAATSWRYALVLDDNPIRYTSGGSQIYPVNANGDSSVATIARMYFGETVTAVVNNARTVGRGILRGVVPTTFDTFVIVSGGTEGGGNFVSAAASGKFVDVTAPIIIGAQQNLVLSLWGASNAGVSTWEFECGWWER